MQDILRLKENFPAGGRLKEIDTPQKGGLSRAGRADDRDYITPVNGKVNVSEHLMISKGFGQMMDLQDRISQISARRLCHSSHLPPIPAVKAAPSAGDGGVSSANS